MSRHTGSSSGTNPYAMMIAMTIVGTVVVLAIQIINQMAEAAPSSGLADFADGFNDVMGALPVVELAFVVAGLYAGRFLFEAADEWRVYDRFAFGRQRTVLTEESGEPMPEPCVNCGKRPYHGKVRTYRTDYTLLGVPLLNVEKGTNYECNQCHEADSLEYYKRTGIHDDILDVDDDELAEIESEMSEASA